MAEFQKQLLAKGIQSVFRHNNEGRLYGVTFVDHGSKTVFNGSDLGKEYSANALAQKFANGPAIKSNKYDKRSENANSFDKNAAKISVSINSQSNDNGILDALFKEEHQDMAAIGRLQQRKRKKKRKGHSL